MALTSKRPELQFEKSFWLQCQQSEESPGKQSFPVCVANTQAASLRMQILRSHALLRRTGQTPSTHPHTGFLGFSQRSSGEPPVASLTRRASAQQQVGRQQVQEKQTGFFPPQKNIGRKKNPGRERDRRERTRTAQTAGPHFGQDLVNYLGQQQVQANLSAVLKTSKSQSLLHSLDAVTHVHWGVHSRANADPRSQLEVHQAATCFSMQSD